MHLNRTLTTPFKIMVILIDTKYGMKSDKILYFRMTIHLVYIGDYKRRKNETRDIKMKLTYS